MAGQQQHVDIRRKLGLRRRLLADALPGAAYVPFCGDGDIAAELYANRPLYGCDTDPERLATIRGRLPAGVWLEANADKLTEFPADALFDVGDFDAYVDPYPALRNFIEHAPLGDRVVLFLTDGHRQRIKRSKTWIDPEGQSHKLTTLATVREHYNFYWPRYIEPWLRSYLGARGWQIDRGEFYLRKDQVYAGLVISRAAVAYGARAESTTVDGPPAELLGYNPLKQEKFDLLRKRLFLRLVAQGQTRSAAAKRVGVNLRTVQRHVERYPSFGEQIDWAEMEADEEVEGSLRRAAVSGNVKAAETWLFNRRPERWADRREQKIKLVTDDETLRLIADIISRTVTDGETLSRLREEFGRLALD